MINVKKLVLAIVVPVILLGAVGCGKTPEGKGQDQIASKPDNLKSGYFVDVAWLKDNLNRVVILDARKEQDYRKGHLPGAVNAPWQAFADMDGKPGEPDWGTLLPAEKLSASIGVLGIDGTRPVVVYADPPGWGDEGRVVWTMRVAGVKDARMLDGGWKAWTAGKNEVSTADPVVKPAAFTVAALNANFNATTAWVSANSARVKIIDSRSPKEYAGATDFGEARGGHLPGATNISFTEVFKADGTIKSSADLQAMFSRAGLQQADEIVTYCTKGIRSAYMALLLRMTGFQQARNYDASFYSWAGDPSLPLEK